MAKLLGGGALLPVEARPELAPFPALLPSSAWQDMAGRALSIRASFCYRRVESWDVTHGKALAPPEEDVEAGDPPLPGEEGAEKAGAGGAEDNMLADMDAEEVLVLEDAVWELDKALRPETGTFIQSPKPEPELGPGHRAPHRSLREEERGPYPGQAQEEGGRG